MALATVCSPYLKSFSLIYLLTPLLLLPRVVVGFFYFIKTANC